MELTELSHGVQGGGNGRQFPQDSSPAPGRDILRFTVQPTFLMGSCLKKKKNLKAN